MVTIDKPKSKPSWIPVPNKFIYSLEHSIIDKSVYITTRSFSNFDTGECYPGINTISKKCGFSDKTVIRSLKRLESAGWIEIIRREDTSNSYAFPHDEFDEQGNYTNYEPIPLILFDICTGKEFGLYGVLFSFYNRKEKKCIVTKEQICKRADICNGSKLIVTLLDLLEKKGAIVKRKTNRGYDFSFPLSYSKEYSEAKSKDAQNEKNKDDRKKVT